MGKLLPVCCNLIRHLTVRCNLIRNLTVCCNLIRWTPAVGAWAELGRWRALVGVAGRPHGTPRRISSEFLKMIFLNFP